MDKVEIEKHQEAFKEELDKKAEQSEITYNRFSRAIDTIMNAHLQGVHAPLVELGTVDRKYTTAMEVACGNKMTHIVVDNEEAATAAIELLLSTRAGRATFIPLNKIAKVPSSLNLPKDNGVIDFAINLVDFDNKYINAFYYAVGETIVVENMECAKKLIGKYRMVTLRGELFEKSGLITGGLHIRLGLNFKQNKDFAVGTKPFDVFQACYYN